MITKSPCRNCHYHSTDFPKCLEACSILRQVQEKQAELHTYNINEQYQDGVEEFYTISITGGHHLGNF